MNDEITNEQVDEPEAPAVPAEIEQPELTPETFTKAISQEPPRDEAPAGDEGEQPAVVDEGYNLASVLEDESLPQALREDPLVETMLNEAGSFAKQAGLSPTMARTLTSLYSNLAMSEQGKHPPLEDQQAVEWYLQKQLGDGYQAHISRAQATAKSLGPKFLHWLGETGLGNSPAMLHILAGLGKGGMLAENTPEWAQAEMKRLRTEKGNPLNTPHAKGREAWLVRWKMLSALANMKGDGDASERRSERDGRQAMKDLKNPPKASDPRVKYETEAKALMRSEAWSDKRNPAHKEVARRVAELFRLAYPE